MLIETNVEDEDEVDDDSLALLAHHQTTCHLLCTNCTNCELISKWCGSTYVLPHSFSNLFSGTDRPHDPLNPYLNMKYASGEEEASPALLAMRKQSRAERGGRGSQQGQDLFDGETM